MGDPIHDTPEADLWVACKAGDQAARAELIRRHMALVWWWVGRNRRRAQALEFDDAISAGYLGLVKAIDRFDPDRWLALSTYAVHWIAAEVVLAAERETRIERARAEVVERRALDCRVDEHTPDLDFDTAVLQDRVARALTQLPVRMREVARRRLMTDPPDTLQAIGEDVGVCRERVRQIEVEARKRLRRALSEENEWLNE